MSNNIAKREPSIKNKQAVNVAKKMGKRYSLMDAALAGKRIGIKWQDEKFTVGDLLVGMHYELEHGKVDPETNVTGDNVLKTAKIAWAHLKERPDYYVHLMKIDPPHKPEKKASEILDEMCMEKEAGDYAKPFESLTNVQRSAVKKIANSPDKERIANILQEGRSRYIQEQAATGNQLEKAMRQISACKWQGHNEDSSPLLRTLVKEKKDAGKRYRDIIKKWGNISHMMKHIGDQSKQG